MRIRFLSSTAKWVYPVSMLPPEKEKLEDVVQALPQDLRQEVLAFAKSLLRRKTNGDQGGVVNVRSVFGIWDSGDPNSADNVQIEADLARAYSNPHKSE